MPKAAVLGSPISHSKSPLLHSAAYRALDLPWSYERHEVDEAGFASFMRERGPQFRGLSLTMPLKRVAFATADECDDAGMATGAINTLVLGDTIRGYNTDVVGFREALRAAGVPMRASATVIGTGATARSAAYAMVLDGVRELHVVGRRATALDEMAQWLKIFGVDVTTHPWTEPLPETQLTLATVVAGATDDLQIPHEPGLLFDAVYAPWPTRIAMTWEAAGGRVLSGTDLLVHQAAQQVLHMTLVHEDNREAIVTAMYAALRGLEFGA